MSSIYNGIVRSWESMVWIIQERHVLFNKEGFHLTASSSCWVIIANANILLCLSQTLCDKDWLTYINKIDWYHKSCVRKVGKCLDYRSRMKVPCAKLYSDDFIIICYRGKNNHRIGTAMERSLVKFVTLTMPCPKDITQMPTFRNIYFYCDKTVFWRMQQWLCRDAWSMWFWPPAVLDTRGGKCKIDYLRHSACISIY